MIPIPPKPKAPLGRGALATRDMRARVAQLRADGQDVIAVLWARYARAAAGDGFHYEYGGVRDGQ